MIATSSSQHAAYSRSSLTTRWSRPYSVPGELAGQTVAVRISLEGLLRIWHSDRLVATHALRNAQEGWSSVPDHHACSLAGDAQG